MASFVEGEMDYKFKPIKFQGSPKQISRLRNGHKVRIKPEINGEGICLMVKPSKYSTISKTFNRGKGVEIALDVDEILQNQQEKFEGRGIFSKIGSTFKKVGKKIGSSAKKIGRTIGSTAKKVAPVVAPIAEKIANKVIDKAVKYAPELGATALTGLAIAAGQPELVPVAAMLGKELGKEAGKAGGKAAKKQTKKTFGKKEKASKEKVQEAPTTQTEYQQFVNMMQQEQQQQNLGNMLTGRLSNENNVQLQENDSNILKKPEVVFNSAMIGNKPLTKNWVGGVGQGLYVSGKGIYSSGSPVVGSGIFSGFGLKKKTTGSTGRNTIVQNRQRKEPLEFLNFHQQLPKYHKGGVF